MSDITSTSSVPGQPLPGSVEVTTGDGFVTIALVGEHDLSTRPQLEPQLHSAALGDGGVVADLTRTSFLDSTILHVLVRADSMMRDRGRRLVLLVPEGEGIAKRALEISGLAETMCCGTGEAEAAELARSPHTG